MDDLLQELIDDCPADSVIIDDPNFNGELEVVSRYVIEEPDFDKRRLIWDPLKKI
ncbi:MAG: hypothetical protein ACFFKA_00040 [Candidatus Thorarchaeota archaeon]